MGAITYGDSSLIFGIPLVKKPVKNLPCQGRMRMRFRNDTFAKIFIRTETATRCFMLQDNGRYWTAEPKYEQAANYRQKAKKIEIRHGDFC